MVPPATKVKLSLGSDSEFVLRVSIDGVPDTIDCPEFTVVVETPKDGLTARSKGSPAIPKPCPDAVAGLDHVEASGTWSLDLDSTGTAGSLTLPHDGARVTFNGESSCVVTLSPSGETHLEGSYNGSDKLSISGADVPASGSGCTVRKASVSADIVLEPNVRVEH